MKASTEVGDIVLLPYTNFKGEKSNALFLIIHHERYIDGDHNLNFTGVKISSREYKYSIALSAQHVPALDHDSFININQQHRSPRTGDSGAWKAQHAEHADCIIADETLF